MDETLGLVINFGHQATIKNLNINPRITTWEYLRAMLKYCSGHKSMNVYYLDEDDDHVIIESEDELNEAYKVARSSKNDSKLNLYVYGDEVSPSVEDIERRIFAFDSADERERQLVICKEIKPNQRLRNPPFDDAPFYLCCTTSGLVLDICDASRTRGTKLILWPRKSMSEGVTNQLWYTDGPVIRSLLNGFCIDVNGDQLVVNPYEEGKMSQHWFLYGDKSLRNSEYTKWIVGVSDPIRAGVSLKIRGDANKIRELEWIAEDEDGIPLEPYKMMNYNYQLSRQFELPSTQCNVHWYPYPYPYPRKIAIPTREHEKPLVRHEGVICDVCDKDIVGIRYKCGYCYNYDLCEDCEAKPGVHDSRHILLKIKEHLLVGTNPLRMATIPPVSCPRVAYRPEVIGPVLLCSKGQITASPGVFDFSQQSEPIVNKEPGRLPDADFVEDETIPDDTRVDPGATLLKKWKVRNVGTEPWSSKTVLRHVSGELKFERSQVSVPYIEPGQCGTVDVELTAPLQPGNYESHWQLFSRRDKAFGPDLWCRVIVEEKRIEEINQRELDENVIDAVDNIPSSVSLPSTPANTPLAVTPPLTPICVKMTPFVTICGPNDDNEGEELTYKSSNQGDEDETSGVSATAPEKNEELDIVVNKMKEMSCIDNLGDDSCSWESSDASDAEGDDFYVVPIPDCFNTSLPARKEASTTIVVKKDIARLSRSYSSSTVEESETSAVWLPPPPIKFMNQDHEEESDSDLDSFCELHSEVCETRSVSSLEDLDDDTTKQSVNMQLAKPAVEAAVAVGTNDLNKEDSGVRGENGCVGGGMINSNIESQEFGTARLDVTDRPTIQPQPEVRDDDLDSCVEAHNDTIEEAEEATETLSGEQTRAKNETLEEYAFTLMTAAMGVAKDAASAAFSTAKDVYHTLQAKNSYTPPRSTWTPPENTWTPPASTWTPVQPTWSPSEQQWVQPEVSSPALDQLANAEANIPPAAAPQEGLRPFPTPSPMQKLIEMGFANRELNASVLEAYHNNLQAAIQELLHLGNSEWYNTRH